MRHRLWTSTLCLLAAALLLAPFSALAQDASAKAEELPAPKSWLTIAPVDRSGRQAIQTDAVFERYLLSRDAAAPRAGETLRGDRGEDVVWKGAEPDDRGRIAGRVGYAYTAYESDTKRVVWARLAGGAVLWINGTPWVGDVYNNTGVRFPVVLRKGVNHIFVRGVRGAFRLRFFKCTEGLHVLKADTTVPDLVVGEPIDTRMAFLVANGSLKPVSELRTSYGQFERPFHGGLAPLSYRKIWVGLSGPAPQAKGKKKFTVEINDQTHEFELAVREPGEPHRRTFLSFIDGSLQVYAERLPTGDASAASLLLSLHGAGVGCMAQARAYGPMKDFHLVCPTNRRPFGFDWQDWGRLDAYEVLNQVLLRSEIPRSRVFLTGHSMGGHGTWHLAAHDPDGFVAIGPSAGWASFDSYVGRPKAVLTEPWRGADGASVTSDYLSNLTQVPAYILHGADDDNVPAREGRAMLATLTTAGARVEAHFEPGVKHWWDKDKKRAGADCVDWAPMWEFFRKHDPRRGSGDVASDPASISFHAVDSSHDPEHHWVRLQQARHSGSPVAISATQNGKDVHVTTTNLRSFATMLRGEARRFVIDGQVVRAPAAVSFVHGALGWAVGEPARGEKRAERCGPFKRAFGNRFVLVYGATDSENQARARFDQQGWWYRGNGDCAVVSDVEYMGATANKYADRNVILYGNRHTNKAFDALLPDSCPIVVDKGSIRVGEREWKGDSLSCLFVYPMRDSHDALVGVFGSTGDSGARLGFGLRPFVSGVGYPDYCVFDASILKQGFEGVGDAGWFDYRWRLVPAR